MSVAPLVSVVIPCYNYAHLIGETLQSVRDQILADWECVIVDDGSTDNTGRVVQEFVKRDPRFRYFACQNQGPSLARNFGVERAHGQFLQFLDADDLIEPRKLEAQIEFFKAHPDVDVVVSGVRYFDAETPHQLLDSMPGSHFHFLQGEAKGMPAVLQLIGGNFCVINAPLIRRNLVQKLGGFEPSLWVNEDWDLWMRAANARAHFAFLLEDNLNRALVRLHAGSLSSSSLRMHLSLSDLRARWDEDGFFAPEFEAIARAENLRQWFNDEWSIAKMQARHRQVVKGWLRAFRLARKSRKLRFWGLFLAYPLYAQSLVRTLARRRNFQ